jgi:phospholipid/cholesterol/gamma-HCH transport system ATP-binding protein
MNSTSSNHATSDDALITIENIDFGFDRRLIFEGLSLTIPRGKVTAIMGPSGCGKSTLLGLIGGRLRPRRGSIEFEGRRVDKARGRKLYALRREMGMLFQNSALLTDLSTFENIGRDHSIDRYDEAGTGWPERGAHIATV